MHSVLINTWDNPPIYTTVARPPTPTDPSKTLIHVLATGIHRVVRSCASGKHYTATTLPHVPGVDGIGTTSSGALVYFSTLRTGGSFSEYIVVPIADTVALPEGVDPVKAAALVNPALSSWMALRTRCRDLPEEFSVLIMGATSTSGEIAIGMARALGAKRVVGVARNAAALEKLGLDEVVVLQEKVDETDWNKVGDVDVVLDYIYGEPTVKLFDALKTPRPLQYVQIGGLAGGEMNLAGSVLRSKDVTIRGSGPGAWSMRQLREELPAILKAIGKIEGNEPNVFPLSEVEKAWVEGQGRVVFKP